MIAKWFFRIDIAQEYVFTLFFKGHILTAKVASQESSVLDTRFDLKDMMCDNKGCGYEANKTGCAKFDKDVIITKENNIKTPLQLYILSLRFQQAQSYRKTG